MQLSHTVIVFGFNYSKNAKMLLKQCSFKMLAGMFLKCVVEFIFPRFFFLL